MFNHQTLQDALTILEEYGLENQKGKRFHTFKQSIEAYMETNHDPIDIKRLLATIQDNLNYADCPDGYTKFLDLWRKPMKQNAQ